jgi:heme/copper-type cytochrome/quinol oxidase subunit 2
MDVAELIKWLMGVVMIAIGVPLFFLGMYFRAPENEKKQKAGYLQVIGIIWMAGGVLIYIVVLLSRFAV